MNLNEELKRDFLKTKDIFGDKFSTTVWHPERKNIDYDVETSYSSNIDPFNMYSTDAESNLAGDRLVRRWRQLSLHPIPNECLKEIVYEAITLSKEMLKVDTSDIEIKLGKEVCEDIEKSFDKIFRLLKFNKNADKLFHQFFMDGKLNYEAIYNNKKPKLGIIKMDLLAPFGMRKVYYDDTKRFV